MKLGSAAARAAFFAALVAFGAVLALARSGDGPPPDDADLMALPAPIADHENGFVSLSAAAELLAWPDDEAEGARWAQLARGEAWDDERAARAVAANAAPLDALARAARAPAFQSPPIRDAGSDVPDVSLWTRLAQVAAVRARAAAARGDAPAAAESALLLARLGRLVSANPNGALLSGLTGLRIAALGLDAIEAGLPLLAAPGDASARLLAELGALRVDAGAWRRMWASEYRTLRALGGEEADLAAVFDANGRSAMRWVAVWLPRSYVYQPNNSWRDYLARVRARQAAAGAACAARAAAGERLGDLALLLPNSVGRLSAAAAPLAHYDTARCLHDTRVELLRAGLALLAFERERGALPPSLEALAPGRLPDVPRDWFAEGALRLDRAGRVVYSVGSDGVDDGGRPSGAGDEAREPRLALPAPLPR